MTEKKMPLAEARKLADDPSAADLATLERAHAVITALPAPSQKDRRRWALLLVEMGRRHQTAGQAA